jgi:dihydroneopterin aldolase
LLERLAEAITQAILESDRITKVKVTVTKPSAPIPDFGGKIAIELIREREG